MDSNDLIFKGLEAKITPKAGIGGPFVQNSGLWNCLGKIGSNYENGGGRRGLLLSVCKTLRPFIRKAVLE